MDGKQLDEYEGGDGLVINAGPRALGSLDSDFTFTIENSLSPYATLVNKSTSGNPGRRASDESRTCIISDGFKGTTHFTEMVSLIDAPNTPKDEQYQNPQAILCVRHLCGSARENEKTKKRPGTFDDGLVYAIAKACSENEQKKAIRTLAVKSPGVAEYLEEKDPLVWKQRQMSETLGLCLYGHSTSNGVEGENGCVKKERRLHPYDFADAYMMRLQSKYTEHRTEIENLHEKGIAITPFAQRIFENEFSLSRLNAGYKCYVGGGKDLFLVQDTQAVDGLRRVVNINPLSPDCHPCRTWSQHHIPCRHMLIALGRHNRNIIVDPVLKQSFFVNYFHPAYLVSNAMEAYNSSDLSTVIGFPEKVSGEGLDVEDIDVKKSDNPFEEYAVTVGKKMLPPVGYSIDEYKFNKPRGRPRTKRIRERGDFPGSGGGKISKQRKSVRSGRSAGSQDTLADINIDNFFKVVKM